MPAPHILMVVSPAARPGIPVERTGVWLDAFAAPYYAFTDQGLAVTVATVDGAPPVIAPQSLCAAAMTPAARRYGDDLTAHAAFASAIGIAELDPRDFDAVFLCGGGDDTSHAATLASLIHAFHAAKKPIAALGQLGGGWAGPPVLVDGHRITGRNFAASESTAAALLQLLGAAPQ